MAAFSQERRYDGVPARPEGLYTCARTREGRLGPGRQPGLAAAQTRERTDEEDRRNVHASGRADRLRRRAAARPTDEIADALKDTDNPASAFGTGASDEAIECIAEALHDSDLSDEALQALVDGDEDFEANKDDEEAVNDIVDDIGKCVTG